MKPKLIEELKGKVVEVEIFAARFSHTLSFLFLVLRLKEILSLKN